MRKLGDSNPRYGKPVRQFSKLVVSATHPNFLVPLCAVALFLKRGAKVRLFFKLPNFWARKIGKSVEMVELCVIGGGKKVIERQMTGCYIVLSLQDDFIRKIIKGGSTNSIIRIGCHKFQNL